MSVLISWLHCFSRRAADTHHSAAVVEAAPVPDLLGSILTGQSMLLMDSSDVIINRDGSLKASKPGKSLCHNFHIHSVLLERCTEQLWCYSSENGKSLLFVFCVAVVPSSLTASVGSTSALADAGTDVTPVMSPNQGDSFPSPHHHSEGSASCRPLPHSSSHMASSASPLFSSPQVHPRLQPPGPVRPAFHPSHRRTSEPQLPSSCASSRSSTFHQESNLRNKGTTALPLKKAPVKQMWEDVSVLPRIPKIKRDNVGLTNGASHRNSSSSNSATNSRVYGMLGTGMNGFSGDKGRQHSVDQHKGRTEGQARRPRPDTAASSSSSSSAFSNSFSSSSSSAASGQYQSSSSSSSSAAVSFRINSSGNSWHSRRLNAGPASSSGSAVPDVERDREEAARKKQLRRDKQMLLASRTLGGTREEDSNNMYDPFNPTLSESCSSDEEAESTSLDNSSQCTTQDEEASTLVKEELDAHNSDNRFCVADETHNRKIIKEEPSGDGAQRAASLVSSPPEDTTVKRESGQDDSGTDNQTFWSIKVKVEPESDSSPERKATPGDAQTGEAKVNVDCSRVKDERRTGGEQNGSYHSAASAAPVVCKTEPSASAPAPTKKKCKTEAKRDSKSPLKDLRRGQGARQESSSSESDRRRRKEPRSAPDQDRQPKESKEEQPSSKQRRRRGRSSSDSSHSDSSDGEHRRKQRARSRSRERRRSRYFWV